MLEFVRAASVQRERESEERDDEDPEHSSGPDRDLETTSSSIRLYFKAFQALMNIRDVSQHQVASAAPATTPQFPGTYSRELELEGVERCVWETEIHYTPMLAFPMPPPPERRSRAPSWLRAAPPA